MWWIINLQLNISSYRYTNYLYSVFEHFFCSHFKNSLLNSCSQELIIIIIQIILINFPRMIVSIFIDGYFNFVSIIIFHNIFYNKIIRVKKEKGKKKRFLRQEETRVSQARKSSSSPPLLVVCVVKSVKKISKVQREEFLHSSIPSIQPYAWWFHCTLHRGRKRRAAR